MALRGDLLALIGVILGALFWLIDSGVDVLLLDTGHDFRSAVFAPEPIEIWMRTVVFALFVLFGFYARANIATQHRYQLFLNAEKARLEKEIEMRKGMEESLRELATTDPLTSILNRRKICELMDYEIKRTRRYDECFSILLCDIDHFKKINDAYGHNEGDNVIKEFCSRVSTMIRDTDMFARWGGEEFIILAVGSTADDAVVIAEKIRKDVAENMSVGSMSLSVSAGVTQFREGDDAESLVNRADRALYQAKEEGRNGVKVVL